MCGSGPGLRPAFEARVRCSNSLGGGKKSGLSITQVYVVNSLLADLSHEIIMVGTDVMVEACVYVILKIYNSKCIIRRWSGKMWTYISKHEFKFFYFYFQFLYFHYGRIWVKDMVKIVQ